MLIIRVSYITAALLTVVKIGIIAKYPLKGAGGGGGGGGGGGVFTKILSKLIL